jgi:hypothetical protein
VRISSAARQRTCGRSPPEPIRPTFSAAVAVAAATIATDQEADLLEDVRAAAEDDDTDKVQELQGPGVKLDSRSDELARRLGANECVTE